MTSRLLRTLLALVLVVAAALLVAEATMQPTAADRLALVAIFGSLTAATALAAWVLPKVVARSRSLRHAVVFVAMAAIGTAAATVVVSAGSMFLSVHDLRLVLVALALGVALGIVLAAAVARPLEEDLHRLSVTAERVAGGDLALRTGVDRPDEVGEVAAAFDGMIARLAAAEDERTRMEAARRDFLAAVSHDLRTPLTLLRSAVEALQDGLAPDPDRYLAAMRHDLELLGVLVDDLFVLARIESGGLDLAPERCDLAELVDEAVEAMAPMARPREVRLEVDASGAAPVVVDPTEIRRVLRNLLDNAIRHTPTGTTVRLRVRHDDGQVTLEVVDEGPGFPEAFRAVAFDSFTRADAARSREQGGAGLGLAIARGLVEAHDGSIEAAPGPGGRVRVTLPSR